MSSRQTIIKSKPVRSRSYEAALGAANSAPANHTPMRWTCHHHMGGSDITAYVVASNGLEVIAEARQSDGINARANAELIVRAVNNHDRYQPVIDDLVAALELCLKDEGLSWAAEQEADIALRRARGVIS